MRKAAKGRNADASPGGAKEDGASTAADRRRAIAELRAFAHPLRLRLYELFAEKPRTTMQVAEILGEPPTRLYHHVNALQKSGLLRVKETRPIRGTVEKYFEIVRTGLKGATGDVLTRSPAARQSARAAASAVLEQTRQDLFAEFDELRRDRPGAIMLRMLLGATPARATAISKRLFALVQELKAECGEPPAEGAEPAVRRREPNEERWALTIAFTRSWPRRRGGDEG